MQRRHPRACLEDLPWLPILTVEIGLQLCRSGRASIHPQQVLGASPRTAAFILAAPARPYARARKRNFQVCMRARRRLLASKYALSRTKDAYFGP